MSAQLAPPTGIVRTHPRSRSPWPRAIALVFGAMVLSLVGRIIFSTWEPPFQGGILFDDIAPLGASYWAMNVFLCGPTFLLTFVTGAISLVSLGRGSATSLAGGTLVFVGGSIFTPAIVAEVMPFALAADPAVMPEAQGRSLFDLLNGHLDVVLLPIVVGSILVALGVLIAVVGLLVTRAIPLWLSIGVLAYIVLFQALPLGELHPALFVASNVLELGLWFLIALFALLKIRRGTHAAVGAAESADA
ncbi:hypothetical protein [Naasia lichenicola]|uniref:DUF4386 domain-containing protein n=1 Tax=Naasia lichenicola TaxID=2565933 RepID=A0A4S4FI05_9MICO|nr:hypothetical protein [Naasia lichenicola]THG29879.1 hypothetical protein E6C64_14610 [Naasia lichenicola]